MIKMLTKEGQVMAKRLELPKPPTTLVKKFKQTNLDALKVEFYESELKELIENSKNVVEDCDRILSLCKTGDQYLSNDAKVAKMIHGRLIIRYTRLLNWQSALDK